MAGVDPQNISLEYREHIPKLAADDAKVVVEKDIQYGASWCKRGGAGAYMVMVRKSDRIEQRVEQYGYDVFKAAQDDTRAEGIIDDIRDLRGYLLLIEAYLIENRVITPRYDTEGRCPHLACSATGGQDWRCNKIVGHSGRCDFDGRCPEYFDGIPNARCSKAVGHEGCHSASLQGTDHENDSREWT